MGEDFSTAYIGNSYEDASEQYRKSGDNRVSAEDLQSWWENQSSNDSQDKINFERYKALTEPHTSLYALHICKKDCIRTGNNNVGGGSVSFIKGDEWRRPHFKRSAGGTYGNHANNCSEKGICDANTNYPNDDPDKENVTVTNPLVNNFLRLEIKKENVEIKDSLIEVDYWPQRIPSDKRDDIINYLAERTNGERLTGGSEKIRLTEKYQESRNGNQVITFADNEINDVKLSIRQFGKKNIRIYRCKTGDLEQHGDIIKGDFTEWRGLQRKTEREYKYDNNELLLLWIPDDNDIQAKSWQERCSDEVRNLIEEMNIGRMRKNFFPFVASDYGGFFILIGKRDRIEGSQLPFISRRCNMDKILLEIKKKMKSRGFPFYRFILDKRNLEIIWLEQNTLFTKTDSGLDITLKTSNGEIHIMVSSAGKNNHDENINWIDLMVEDDKGKRILAEKKIKTTGGRNASFSLRIKRKGEYRMYLETNQKDKRVLNMFVEKNSSFENSIYCEGEKWKKMNELKMEDVIIAEPIAHKNLCKKILESEFPRIKDYIDYDNRNWKKKQNRKGLMIEVNRTIFQMYKDTEGYVDSGTWTRYTNKMYTAIETLNWPKLEQYERLTVPKIGVLQVLSGDHYPEAIWDQDIIINWKWKTWEQKYLVEEIGGKDNCKIIHSTKTFKQLVAEDDFQKIGIDYETGFRFGYSETKYENYLDNLLQIRGIEKTPIDFLTKLWEAIENHPSQVKSQRRRMRYDPGKKLNEQGGTYSWKMSNAFPYGGSDRPGPRKSENMWQMFINDGVGIDLDFEEQNNEDRRQLFLELNYYNGEDWDKFEERLDAEIYLGCLYQTNGEISEKMVLVGTTQGWKEDRESNLKWIDKEKSKIGGKNGYDFPNLVHLLYPLNKYSDTRFLEREIIRSFRTIFKNQNNNTLDVRSNFSLDIPNWVLFQPGEDNSLIKIKIQSYMRYVKNLNNHINESEDELNKIMWDNLKQKFWW